jgi:hypothetical protein
MIHVRMIGILALFFQTPVGVPKTIPVAGVKKLSLSLPEHINYIII